MSVMQKLRQTGRTTRMLDDAVFNARKGRAVYVITDCPAQHRHIEHKLGAVGHQLGIKVELLRDVSNFDWQTMSLRHAHPNVMVFVDHYTIERRCASIIEALHKYDAEDA